MRCKYTFLGKRRRREGRKKKKRGERKVRKKGRGEREREKGEGKREGEGEEGGEQQKQHDGLGNNKLNFNKLYTWKPTASLIDSRAL